MPVRHSQLADLNYVPSYNTLDTNLIAGVDGQIQQQSARNRQFGSQIQQNLQEQVLSTTGGLPEEFQQEATALVDESMRNIDQIFEQRGARGTMPTIQREAQRVQRELQPYQQVAQQAQQYQQRIDEAEKVDPTVRRWARQQGQVGRDESGRLRFQGIPTEAFDNWQDLGKATQEFFKQANADVQQGNLQPSATFPQQYMERITNEVLGKNKLKVAGVANLLNNDQYRSQIEYELVARGINPDENVEAIIQNEIKDPDTGEVLQEEKRIKTSALHQRAMEIVDPSASIKAYNKQTVGDTRTNLEAQRLIDDSMPSLSSTIRMGIPEREFGTPSKLSEGIIGKNEVLKELNTALENSENEYERATIQDSINQVEAERDGFIRHQERALNEAGIDQEAINNVLAQFINTEDVDHPYDPSQMASRISGTGGGGMGYALSFRNQTPKTHREAIEEYQQTGILNDRILTILSRNSDLNVNGFKNILKESASAFATNTTISGFTSKGLADDFTRQGSMMFSAGDQGDAAMDLVRLHSDPSKAKSIFETGFNEDIADIEAGGYYVDPTTSELHIAYKAFDADGKPLGLVGGKAPTGTFEYLRPEDQHQLRSYQSSMVDVAMRAPGKEVTIDQPVFSEGRRLGDTKVTIRSRLAQNEDGTVSTRDTFGEQFVVIFNDENGRRREVPAKSKGEALDYLEYISLNNIDAIDQRFGIK